MGHTRIKVCGITSVADAEMACRLGVDAVGLNLYSGSKRHIDLGLAQRIASAVPAFVETVALFVNTPLPELLGVAQTLTRTIQWHGEEPPLPPPVPWRFIPAFQVADAADLEAVTGYLDRCRVAGQMPAAVLIDSHVPGQYGGTGQTAPWKLLAGLELGVPMVLAGGLTPDNVSEAIRIVKPYAVDVASGVESEPGRKDSEKLKRFVDAVKQS